MRLLIFLFLSLSQLACSKPAEPKTPTPPPSASKPNIIFIVVDSHRGDALGVAGNPFVITPNLDQLAQSGVMFDHAYVTTAICSVSRASLLSGQHRARHGINDFTTSFTHQAMLETFPVLLRANGYSTASIGSYGVGNVAPSGYYDYFESGIPWMANGVHNTDNIVRKAEAWLEKQSDDKPFHLYLGFSAAHEIDPKADVPAHYLVPERHQVLYNNVTIPRPETADERYWEAFPDFFRTDENIARERWHGFFSSDELFQQNAKDYYRLVTGLDEAVGRIREKLASMGVADNTIIVYTSDHGVSLGEHGIMGKWYGFDVGIHVPLIIYDPRKDALHDVESQSMALNIDVAPTILNMAGIPVPSRMQGIDLMDLAGGKIDGRDAFFYEHTVFDTPRLPKVEGVVTKTTRYMKYPEHDYEALYDFANDPEERVNVAEDPAYAETLAEMRALFEKERAAAR
ncbi:sulfatase family protein [Parapedobacter sp. 10938]|uniref:sulfatase family protein n=1 Tax=Parapedobacter flavus TaxID=3110225 RepID=UPI002DBADEE2|nr:sulfatase [Parapedobacter sp. 10938]MEC3881650.1 sulfatase [Parapedobacter sp. 10938]